MLGAISIVFIRLKGSNEQQVIIIEADDISTSTLNTINISVDNQESEQENKAESQDIQANTLLGVWITEVGDIYTIDNNEVLIYKASNDSVLYGVYETDGETYITLNLDNNNTEEYHKYTINWSNVKNEYGNEFIELILKNDNDEIKLIKQYDIEEQNKYQQEQHLGISDNTISEE